MCIRQNVLYETLVVKPPTCKSKKISLHIQEHKPAKNFTNSTIANCKALGKEASLKKCPKKDTIAVIPISGYRN